MYNVCSLGVLHWPSMEGPWLITACIQFTFAYALLPSSVCSLWCIRPPVWLGFFIFCDGCDVDLLLWMLS